MQPQPVRFVVWQERTCFHVGRRLFSRTCDSVVTIITHAHWLCRELQNVPGLHLFWDHTRAVQEILCFWCHRVSLDSLFEAVHWAAHGNSVSTTGELCCQGKYWGSGRESPGWWRGWRSDHHDWCVTCLSEEFISHWPHHHRLPHAQRGGPAAHHPPCILRESKQ